ncbi:pyridoxamine 5'-phosphate oxidase family protein [Spirosoma gilvum]
MAKNYASLAFTESVRKLQEKYGSRDAYARFEKAVYVDGLTRPEISFISQRDSFYLATIGENGYPYVQHRGGPKGFLHVLDSYTLGLVDFKGNKQYISVGNILTHPQVSLFLMDYPRQTRLKIYAEASVVELADRPDLFAQLDPAQYKHTPERMLLFRVNAYDWNCPQHITPRYTEEEMLDVFAAQQTYIAQLEQKINTLQNTLNDQKQ